MRDNGRRELLSKIQMVSFVLVDVNLFLDTHPEDMTALDYYHKHQVLLDQLRSQYINEYGPLTPGTVVSNNRWTWIDQPWPWEREA